MRLSEFIRAHSEELCTTWEDYARTLLPASARMDSLALRDHCSELLLAIADVLECPQPAAEALGISIARYSALVDDTRELFLAMPGHDLRAPLNSITMTAETLRSEHTPKIGDAAARILQSGLAIDNMATELLDSVSGRLTAARAPPFRNVDLTTLCASSISICQAAHPGVEVLTKCRGPESAEADALAELLRAMGYRTEITHSAPDAWDLLDDEEPRSLVVLDVRMPGIDEIELGRALRRVYPKLPVLYVTGFPAEDDDLQPGLPVLRKSIMRKCLELEISRALTTN